MPADAPVPAGLPDGLGRGPGETDALLLLRCLLGPTPRSLHALVWSAGSASRALARIRSGGAGSDNDRSFLTNTDVIAIRSGLDRAGARLAAPGDPDYCPAFLRLADPPIAVFVRGRVLDHGDDRVAVVGSRRPTNTGMEVALDLGRGLALAGVVTVSGGAVGIDAAAHRGALDAGGVTVAVLGSGIDVAHPARNRDLFQRIEASGTLVSEYPPGTPAEPFRFPARNRLIAALSRGVVVVEGAAKSGTRITAEHAVDLGLDVFAVPGPVTSPLAETPLGLIRDGATMIRGTADLLEDLRLEGAASGERALPRGLSADEGKVLASLATSMLPSAVAAATGIPVADTLTVLIALEIRGLVRGVGGRFERTFKAAATQPGA
ncbi:MAG: DNA-protecting protein DprA [Actinobacteria bacterium]|nr:MAG: DNA-protecting protein DprA [Actinomycetota bacterium]TMK91513.1 MAG: DNA-protecting protein DprA [Actinomycetota bacterium]TMM24971.1 MAG: DNA-protecting protein DprA [Actinomycetota bacterium]